MIQSMTGYGYATGKYGNKKIIAELKSLNSRYFDLRLNAPNEYKGKEIDLRNILSEELHRGKVALTINVENSDGEQLIHINLPLIKRYYSTLSELNQELGIPQGDILGTIMKIPGVIQDSIAQLPEEEWASCEKVVRSAAKKLTEFRINEGKALSDDMKSRIVKMMNLLDKIKVYEAERMEEMRKKIHDQLERFFEQDNIDENRFEQELIYYIEKYDITEEKVRLRQHCSYFLDVLMANNKVKGRKLDFIAQEIGREINTLGAKANHSEIQHIAVNLKDELEKIKEQIANVI